MHEYQIFFASNESSFPTRYQKLLLIPMDSLNHAVSNRFNNVPLSLRATDKLQNVKTNLLKRIFQTIQFCMSFLQQMFCLFFCHIMKNIHEVECFVDFRMQQLCTLFCVAANIISKNKLNISFFVGLEVCFQHW